MIAEEKSIKNSIRSNIYILIVAMILSRITQLRILPGLGIGEITVIVFIVKNTLELSKNKFIIIKNNIFIEYWILLFVTYIAGFIVAWIKGVNISPIHDIIIFTLIFIFIIVLSRFYEYLNLRSIYRIIELNYIIGSIFFGIIFIIAQFKPRIFGIELWFEGSTRFCGGANNPHQLVYYILPQIFIGIFLLKNNKKFKIKNIMIIILMCINVLIGMATESDTLRVAWIIGILIYLGYELLFKNKEKMISILIIIFTVILITLILYIMKDEIYSKIQNFFYERDMGGSRITLWKTGIKAWSESILFGLGPGPHSGFYGPHGLTECHNNYIELLTSGGIIALTLYLRLIIKFMKKSLYNPIFIGIIWVYLVYGIAGYPMRQIVFWFYLVTLYYYNKKINSKKWGEYEYSSKTDNGSYFSNYNR